MVDRETRLGRVDLVSTGSDGSGEPVTLRGDDMVATVGIVAETPLLLEVRVLVIGGGHLCRSFYGRGVECLGRW